MHENRLHANLGVCTLSLKASGRPPQALAPNTTDTVGEAVANRGPLGTQSNPEWWYAAVGAGAPGTRTGRGRPEVGLRESHGELSGSALLPPVAWLARRMHPTSCLRSPSSDGSSHTNHRALKSRLQTELQGSLGKKKAAWVGGWEGRACEETSDRSRSCQCTGPKGLCFSAPPFWLSRSNGYGQPSDKLNLPSPHFYLWIDGPG